MSKICFGCGAKLQYSNKEKMGYVDESKYETSKYCKKCFRLIHYGELVTSSEPKPVSYIVNTVNKNAKTVFFLIDFINLFDDVINIYKSIKVPKTLIISKSDIIPENISFSQIRNYLRVIYNIRDEIMFVSNKSNLNTLVKSMYKKEEVYFLGLSNAGKSTLINALLDKFESNNTRLTTSYKKNTTQEFIRITMGNTVIIDSPGFVIKTLDENKLTRINKRIKPITYQNKIKCTYKVGDIFNISVFNSTSVVFYFGESIKIKRDYKELVSGTTFKVKGNSDIVFAGVGFIKITDDTIVSLPESIMEYINIRSSIVGGIYE